MPNYGKKILNAGKGRSGWILLCTKLLDTGEEDLAGYYTVKSQYNAGRILNIQ